MTIVTITSDWIKGDYYSGALKGRLLTLSSEILVVDITNSIQPLDVLQETFILKNSFRNFPKKSIHLMCVNSEPESGSPMVIVFFEGHYFIGINDGRFSLMFDTVPAIAFEIINKHPFSSFSALNLFIDGVDAIINNRFEETTAPCEIKVESIRRVVYDENSIIGRVVYIDSFGNAITNIEKTLFDKLQKGRGFTIYVQGPYNKIFKISRSFAECKPGELLAIFNSLSYLELAINQGNISSLENIDSSTEVRIRFTNE